MAASPLAGDEDDGDDDNSLSSRNTGTLLASQKAGGIFSIFIFFCFPPALLRVSSFWEL